jgi:hypothetical protein
LLYNVADLIDASIRNADEQETLWEFNPTGIGTRCTNPRRLTELARDRISAISESSSLLNACPS